VKTSPPEATRITPPTEKALLSTAWLRQQYLVNRLTSEQIAVECGWSSQYVRGQLRRAGIPLRPPGGGGPDGTVLGLARLNALVAEGLSVAQIADATGYSQAGVYKRLRRSGLTVRPQKTPPDPERAVEVGRLYRQGLSLTVVGARFQRGPEWVKAQLREVGVELRSGGPVPAALDHGQVGELLATGHSVAEIAAVTGRAESTVRQLIRSQGWPNPRRRASTSRLPPLDAAKVGRLYAQERRTIAEIAAQLHCSPDRVRQTLVAAGVPRRLPGRRDDLRPPPITATELRELYVDQDLTIQEVARRLGCSSIRVTAALDRHQIARHRDPHRHHRAPGLDLDAYTLTRLYVLERLDDAAIGARYAVPAWRVRRRRRELGVSRPRPAPPHPAPPDPPPADVLQQLYLVEKLPLVVIARRHHTSAPFVRGWLDDAHIPVQPRTARKHRRALDPVLLRQRYEQQECSAAEIAAELDTTVHLVLRSLHDFGIPVRRGGTRSSRRARDQYQLLAALYADPDVTGFLKRHRIPQRPQRGPIARRFPQPIPLSEPLLRQAYVHLGLSARHIELLTGQPADQILDALHTAGIPVRVTSTPSPWLTRHRTG